MKICETCRKPFDPKRSKQRFCGRSCSTKSYAPKPVPIEQRFWQHVDKNGPTQPHMPTPCWLWTGARDANGYGRVNVDHSAITAHRAAFFIEYGRWPKPNALHRCDHPPCVRPDHLFEGDQKANMVDAASKGRTAAGSRHASRTQPERFLKKLSREQVAQVLRDHAAGASLDALGAQFGVTPQAIRYHVRRSHGSVVR